jgi:hypothetical protein
MSIYGRRGCNDLFSGGFAKKGDDVGEDIYFFLKIMGFELKLFKSNS